MEWARIWEMQAHSIKVGFYIIQIELYTNKL